MANTTPQHHFKVYKKATWSDSWAEDVTLAFMNADDGAAPLIPSATFGRSVGYVKYEHDSTYSAVNWTAPTSILDYWIKVQRSIDDGATWQTIWFGVATELLQPVERADYASGYEVWRAQGIAHLLNRIAVDRSSWKNSSHGTTTTPTMQWVPPFNQRQARGQTETGNRTTARLGTENVYRFSVKEGESWGNWDIADYLLGIFTPDSNFPTISFGGQHVSLNQIVEIHDAPAAPQSLWQWLNRVIDLKRGFGFYLKYDDGDVAATSGTVSVQVFSLASSAVTVGGTTIPANTTTTTFNLGGAFPANHDWRPTIQFRKTSEQRYNKIVVRGERILVVGTFRLNTDLTPNWDNNQEAAYLVGVSLVDSIANDAYRNQEWLRPVYSQFTVPATWDFKANGQPLYYQSDSSGTVTTSTGAPWTGEMKAFERLLPLEAGVKYWTNPKDTTDRINPNGEYLPLFAFGTIDLKPRQAGECALEELHVVNEDLRSGHVRPMDGVLGVELLFSPNHLIADADFRLPLAQTSGHVPFMDWRSIYVTAAFRLDTRQFVSAVIGGDATPTKTLTIDLPNCQYWVATPGTVCDIDVAEGPITTRRVIHASNLVLRNDLAKLESVLAAAKVWYGADRQAISFELSTISRYVEIGTMITAITGGYFSETINTVVTKRVFTVGRDQLGTRIETGYYDLDFAGLMNENQLTHGVAAGIDAVNRRRR